MEYCTSGFKEKSRKTSQNNKILNNKILLNQVNYILLNLRWTGRSDVKPSHEELKFWLTTSQIDIPISAPQIDIPLPSNNKEIPRVFSLSYLYPKLPTLTDDNTSDDYFKNIQARIFKENNPGDNILIQMDEIKKNLNRKPFPNQDYEKDLTTAYKESILDKIQQINLTYINKKTSFIFEEIKKNKTITNDKRNELDWLFYFEICVKMEKRLEYNEIKKRYPNDKKGASRISKLIFIY